MQQLVSSGNNHRSASEWTCRFDAACKRIADGGRIQGGIGTLGEKTLHAILKYAFEPDDSKHEIKIGSFYADIVSESGITEIQTRSFNALRHKLSFFLENDRVTIVYPIAHRKWLVWLNRKTGEVTKKRKSPKMGSACDTFYELYKIKPFLTHPNLRLRIVLLDITEYRNLDGWSRDGKKGSSRYERIPEAWIDVRSIDSPKDYKLLIPQGLPARFTARDYKEASKRSLRIAQIALNVLKHVGAVCPVGKQGNAIVYEAAEISGQ